MKNLITAISLVSLFVFSQGYAAGANWVTFTSYGWIEFAIGADGGGFPSRSTVDRKFSYIPGQSFFAIDGGVKDKGLMYKVPSNVSGSLTCTIEFLQSPNTSICVLALSCNGSAAIPGPQFDCKLLPPTP